MSKEQHTEAFFDKDITESLFYVCENIDVLLREKKNYLTCANENFAFYTTLQAIFSFKYNNCLQRTLHELIVTHALSAERIAPLSFERTLRTIIDEIRGKRNNIEQCIEATHPFKTDLDKIVEQCVGSQNSVLIQMTQVALSLAGFCGKIVLERCTNVPHVELSDGHVFVVKAAIDVIAKFKDVRVVCIDGYIENVSEIHHLLTELFESKESCAIFMRGMSDDVKHTLKLNFDRGKLRAIPIIVPFDLYGANMLVDVAIVAGTDVVSSLKGDLISSIRLSHLPTVESINFSANSTVIHNSLTKSAVLLHVASLQAKRVQCEEFQQKLINLRIRSMLSGHVTIRLKDDYQFVRNSQLIDYSLRAIRSAIEHGVIRESNKIIPAATTVVSQAFAHKCLHVLRDISSILIVE